MKRFALVPLVLVALFVGCSEENPVKTADSTIPTVSKVELVAVPTDINCTTTVTTPKTVTITFVSAKAISHTNFSVSIFDAISKTIIPATEILPEVTPFTGATMVGNATVKLTQTSTAKAGNYLVQVIASEGTAADTLEYKLNVKGTLPSVKLVATTSLDCTTSVSTPSKTLSMYYTSTKAINSSAFAVSVLDGANKVVPSSEIIGTITPFSTPTTAGTATLIIAQSTTAKAGNYLVQVIASEGTAADTLEYKLNVKAAPIVVEASKIQVTDVVLITLKPTSKDSLEFVVTITNAGGADTVGATISSTVDKVAGKFFVTGKMTAKAVLTKTEKIAPLDAGTHVIVYYTGAGAAMTKDSVTVVVEVPFISVVGVPTVVTQAAENGILQDAIPGVKGMESVTSIADLAAKSTAILGDPANKTMDDNAKSVLQTVASLAPAGLVVTTKDPLAVKFSDPEITATLQSLIVTKEIDETADRQVASFAALALIKLPFVQVKSTVVKVDGSKSVVYETTGITVAFTIQESKSFVYIRSGAGNKDGVRIAKATGAISLLSTNKSPLWAKFATSPVVTAIVAGKIVDADMAAKLSGAIAANFGAFGELGAIANTLPEISVAPVAKKFAEQVGADARYTTWNDFDATATGDAAKFITSGSAKETKASINPITTATQTHVFTATDADGDVATWSQEIAFTRWTVINTKVHKQGFVD